jgi:type I restriction enzyme, R subunit
MTFGPEYALVEKPSIDILQQLGYEWLKPSENEAVREGLNQVILKDTFIEAVCRINGVERETARSVYNELLSVTDNEQWTYILRGNYSRSVPGQAKKKTIHLIDFLNTGNNTFTVTNQFKVKSQTTRIPDLVCFVNGIPVVVIEAKSPVNFNHKMGQAFEQIKQYEKEIERLFYSNLFNLITDGQNLMYGTTGAASQYWGYWKDPWPKTDDDFQGELTKGYWCLLEPSRLLDILAHFVVFEKDDNKVVKKICRYQQYRAVNKITNRILEARTKEERRGLIWHTQGSGKSLTMVFSTLKLKTHLTLESENLASPNITVLTDRIDLDTQISNTFINCGLPNPTPIGTKDDLQERIHAGTNGMTLLSTIFKFENSSRPVENSANWILLVDECHRTQEKDLGAFLRKTFPEAWFFGFTGTPIKKTDKDTYANFSPPHESYLDKYSIDDAVRDGATVPILYTSRKVDWQVDEARIDILFDQWFADLLDEKREALKRKLTVGTLLKHHKRIETIAYDIWQHFKTSAMKDGYKAQIVAYDREAVILYKRALNQVIKEDLMQEGLSEEEASERAEAYSVPVYSSNQDDAKPSEDAYTQTLRKELVHYRLDDDSSGSGQTEKAVKTAFKIKGKPPWFLIVCNKLLTGFDAPVESVMYLDNPLKEHNLLQAIARTNRVEGEHKHHGLVVDYVGVTRNLKEALNSYRSEDVQNAMHNLDDLRSELRQAHADVIHLMKAVKRKTEHTTKDDYTPEFDALVKAIATEDQWLIFKRRAKRFIQLYSALTPDPVVLDYKRDLKWVNMFLMYAFKFFNPGDDPVDLKNYSAKIREMLDQELTVTGLRSVVKIRSLSDEAFWNDFKTQGKSDEEIKRASVRKVTELKKTISEKVKLNPEQYEPFSKRLKAIIDRLNQGLDEAAQTLKDLEELSNDLINEEQAHTRTGLTKTAHGIYKILEAYKSKRERKPLEAVAEHPADYEPRLNQLQKIAAEIDDLYQSDETAPPGWYLKEQMRKDLRAVVRRIVHPLREEGLENWKEIPDKVEQYALKHYVVEV